MHDTLELDALNALDRSESIQFEEHLAQCESCSEMLPSFLQVVSYLALMADPVKAPDRLRERVMLMAAADYSANRVPNNVVPLEPRRSKIRRAAFTAVAVAASFALGGMLFTGQQEGTAPSPPSATATVEPTQLELIQAASDSKMVVHKMKKGSLRIDYSQSLDAGIVETKGMPALPSPEVYQLWLKHLDGTLTPAGSIPGGDQMITLPRELKTVVAVGVTREPEAGARVPSSTPLAMLPI